VKGFYLGSTGKNDLSRLVEKAPKSNLLKKKSAENNIREFQKDGGLHPGVLIEGKKNN